VKKIIIFSLIFFLLLIYIFKLYSENISKDIILNKTKNFLTYLQKGDKNGIKNFTHKKMEFNNMTKQQIHELAEAMLSEKISIPDYIIKITGHNINKFLSKNAEILNYKIEGEVSSEITLDKDNKISDTIYYIKILLTYKENNKVIKDKQCEIDFSQEKDGKYYIIGFII